ncbi:MAG: acyl-CoA dehydratase activase-related protein, partial [Sulfurovum sp.]
LKEERKSLQDSVPNLVKKESLTLFAPAYELEERPDTGTKIREQQVKLTLGGWGPTLRKEITRPFAASSQEEKAYRQTLKICIPKVLNVYSLAPFMRTYLQALDLDPLHIVFSGFSNEDMFLEGAKYGSVDSCYPAKVAQSHVYSLLFDKKYVRKGFAYLWFPAVTHLPGFLTHTMGQTACPIVSGTPKVIYSAFTKEKDLFSQQSVTYVEDALDFDNKALLKKQLFNTWKEKLRITEDESDWAADQAWKALRANEEAIMEEGREILENAVKNSEIVLLLLGRPYHSDPGLNHEVLDEFQSLGFKTLSLRSIPKDEAYLRPFFQEEIYAGLIESPYDIRDVWPENFSTNSSQKVWAAKFAARHPNIAVVDLSSFKCGHDAPTYAIIDKILGASRTPHLTLHDIDANKPGGSIKIRVKTFAYTLEQYQKRLKESHAQTIEAVAPEKVLL